MRAGAGLWAGRARWGGRSVEWREGASRVWPDERAEQLEVNQPVLLDGEVVYLEALLLQHAARVEDALVLRLRRDDVPLPAAGRGRPSPL